jgi:Ca2+-transporting ATPase
MWKMILGQAVYQLLITFLLYFASPGILPAYDPTGVTKEEIQTLVFNTFVWMQIFNQWK